MSNGADINFGLWWENKLKVNNKNRNDNLNKEKLTMNVLFSGIGCQERGFQNSILFISPRL